jgi:hypothetical protein
LTLDDELNGLANNGRKTMDEVFVIAHSSFVFQGESWLDSHVQQTTAWEPSLLHFQGIEGKRKWKTLPDLSITPC